MALLWLWESYLTNSKLNVFFHKVENSNLGRVGGCGLLVDRKESLQSTVYTVSCSGNMRVLSPSLGTWSGLKHSSPKPLRCSKLCLRYCMSIPRVLFSPPIGGEALESQKAGIS